MGKKILALAIAAGLSLTAVEVVLRIVAPPARPEASTTGHYIQRSSLLGWEGRPGARGCFASGYCFGRVDLDDDGIRLNGDLGTFREGFANVLFLGDSNTAAFEVDNSCTAPALLEQGLRARGLDVNVLNLGVRGYGTDQSVLRALLFAERFRPEQIVYMYTDNDVFDNNVLREIYRQFGKSVYWRPHGSFEILNQPVPVTRRGDYGAVILDPDGRPLIYEGSHPADGLARPLAWLGRSSRLVRKLVDVRGNRVQQKARHWRERRADPFDVMTQPAADAEDVLLALAFGLVDGGRVRTDHREYYDAQLEFLIGRLREIPSLKKIHLVEFPSVATIGLLEDGSESINLTLFDDLFKRGVVDDLVSLSREMVDTGLRHRDFNCRGGNHFSEEGQRWIAEVLLDRLDFELGEEDLG